MQLTWASLGFKPRTFTYPSTHLTIRISQEEYSHKMCYRPGVPVLGLEKGDKAISKLVINNFALFYSAPKTAKIAISCLRTFETVRQHRSFSHFENWRNKHKKLLNWLSVLSIVEIYCLIEVSTMFLGDVITCPMHRNGHLESRWWKERNAGVNSNHMFYQLETLSSL